MGRRVSMPDSRMCGLCSSLAPPRHQTQTKTQAPKHRQGTQSKVRQTDETEARGERNPRIRPRPLSQAPQEATSQQHFGSTGNIGSSPNTSKVWKYPRVNKVPGNTRSNISAPLPEPNPPPTRLFFFNN